MASANVLLLPEAGSGHLMSLIEAGKRLLAHGGRGDGEGPAVTITVLVVRPATSESAAEVDAHVGRVEASGLGVRFHRLPAVEPPPMGCAAGNAREVAAGLERSGHRFLWALRGPPAAGTLHPTDASLDELLPEGFLERTKGRGLVWPTWAPQKEILAHAAIGGFVTHCGWNSTLESLWHGVPLVPWPLYAEQRLNAFELVRDMGVAVPLGVDGKRRDSFVEAAELERAVRSLMDDASEVGRKAREKAAEMKAVCRNAVAPGGGSSYAALQRLLGAIRGGFSTMTQ
uniref:Uncharacterized protein n=1 Tax=Oryza barthii TaxID=65489 RepID=A0A0D3GRC3_9ORYZ